MKHQLLDLLVDGPSSFAALYSATNRLLRPPTLPRITIEQQWESLAKMEALGWVKARLMLPANTWKEPDALDREKARRAYMGWLPDALYEEMSIDEVGLWFELQPAGRAEWARWSADTDELQKWVLDQDSQTLTITVHAVSIERADRVLADWINEYSHIELIEGTRVVERVAGFSLRDGSSVEGGIQLRVTYREVE